VIPRSFDISNVDLAWHPLGPIELQGLEGPRIDLKSTHVPEAGPLQAEGLAASACAEFE